MQAARHMPCMRGACSLGFKAVLQNCTISVVSNSKEQLCSTTLLAATQEVAQLQLRSGHAHKSTHKHMRTTAYINSSQARTHAAAHHWQGTALQETTNPSGLLALSNCRNSQTAAAPWQHSRPECSVLYHCTSVVLV